jgi:hypothetical protein
MKQGLDSDHESRLLKKSFALSNIQPIDFALDRFGFSGGWLQGFV